MADFDWKWPTHCDRTVVEELMTLAFMKDASNIVLVGPNGVGKTMCAWYIFSPSAAVIGGAWRHHRSPEEALVSC